MADGGPAPSLVTGSAAFAAPAVEAVLVSYGTARLTLAACRALRTCESAVPITVVDNASPDDTVARLTHQADALAPFRLLGQPANRHHGPGMDAGLRASNARRALLLDTDCLVVRHGLIDALSAALDAGAWAAGHVLRVGADGFESEAPDAVPYVHPHCALLDVRTYLGLPPFAKHGAPCLRAMQAAHARGLLAADVPVADWAYHIGRGTVERHGYALGWRSRLAQLKRRIRG